MPLPDRETRASTSVGFATPASRIRACDRPALGVDAAIDPAISAFDATRPRAYSTLNRNVVVAAKRSSGRSTADGKAGWFGASGKPCVSKQTASPER